MFRKLPRIRLGISVIVLALLLNAVVLTLSHPNNRNLFWMLLVSIPLLAIGIYITRKKFINSKRLLVRNTNLVLPFGSPHLKSINDVDFRVLIGNDQCSNLYNACTISISSMKHDSKELPVQTTRDKKVNYYNTSGEENLSTYCLSGGDLVLQVGQDLSGYGFKNANFDSEKFKQLARRPDVKMIELRLHHSFLDRTDTSNRDTIISASTYTPFTDAEGMIHFLSRLRKLSGGKPTGVRLCVNNKKQFRQICFAIKKTQLVPDYLVVEDSPEKAIVFNSENSSDSVISLYDSLFFVSKTLESYGLDKQIKTIAVAKIISRLDMLKLLALGANLVHIEMTDNSPIKSPLNWKIQPSLYKSQNIDDFHNIVMEEMNQVMKEFRFRSVDDITISKFFSRLDVAHSKNFKEIYNPIIYSSFVKGVYNSDFKPHQLSPGTPRELQKPLYQK